MKRNVATLRMAVCWSAVGLGLGLSAGRVRADAVGSWHEDPRRPSATLTEGAPVGGADEWHMDNRRPTAQLAGNSSVESTDPWRQDMRRPDDRSGGSEDRAVSSWRSDNRRPAAWPKAEDSDHDGVRDSEDRCPDTQTGTRVDRNGCPMSAKESELLDTGTLRLENIYFDSEKSTLKAESHAALDEVGEILDKWPELRIEIGGHTDNIGTPDYNRDLSQARADAVRVYLTSKYSLKKNQYTSKGYGETKPVASNDSSEGRAHNRRVEFKVLNREVLRK